MAGKYDFKIDKGSRWFVDFTLTEDNGNPINLTDYTAVLLFDNCELNIIPTITNNVISIIIDGDKTKDLIESSANYNLMLNKVGEENRILEGVAYFSKRVKCDY